MPKHPSTTVSVARKGKPRKAKEKAFRVSNAVSFYLTPAQFKFVRAQRPAYLDHRRDLEARSQYLASLWRRFLETYPEYNTPPFPEDDEMVELFHHSRATALGNKLDNMLAFNHGLQQRVSQT